MKEVVDLKKFFNIIRPSIKRYIEKYLKPINIMILPKYGYRKIDGETAYQMEFKRKEKNGYIIIYPKITIDPYITDPQMQIFSIYDSIYKIFIGVFATTEGEAHYIDKQAIEFAKKYVGKTVELVENKLDKEKFQDELYRDMESALLNLLTMKGIT